MARSAPAGPIKSPARLGFGSADSAPALRRVARAAAGGAVHARCQGVADKSSQDRGPILSARRAASSATSSPSRISRARFLSVATSFCRCPRRRTRPEPRRRRQSPCPAGVRRVDTRASAMTFSSARRPTDACVSSATRRRPVIRSFKATIAASSRRGTSIPNRQRKSGDRIA